MTQEEFYRRWEKETNAFLSHASGVVHIGANAGQERDLYYGLNLPVIWVEPLPSVFEQLREYIASIPRQRAFQYLLTDEDGKEYDFGIANNGGQSSSIFDFGDHKEIWPEVGYIGSIKLKSSTFKSMVKAEQLNLGEYDALVMDVQGAELLVLKGAGDLLNGFRWIRCEAADFEIYKDCCQLTDLDEYLESRGFARVKTWQGAGKPGLGHAFEALYERGATPDHSITQLNSLQAFRESIKLFNKYSQFGEDGIIEAIFNRIGMANKWVMECGAADGVFFSNSAKLIEEGWSAVLIEADQEQFNKLQSRYTDNDHVHTYHGRVEADGRRACTLDKVLKSCYAPEDLDLAIIDVDGQDYWLWNSLFKYRPRVVIIEFDPNTHPDFIPDIGGDGLAGRDAIIKLGYGKLYTPICQTWCNAVFVRQDLVRLLEDESESTPLIQVAACMSTPRFGPLSTFDCIVTGLQQFGMPFFRGEGAFWSQSLTRAIERALELVKPTYILTIDYDTLFCADPKNSDIAKLVCLLHDNPDVDIAIPMQMKREGGPLLIGTDCEQNINQPLIPATLGHFGLTLFRASVFSRLSKPWFKEEPDPNGSWHENHVDSDIYFWRNCQENNIKFCLATDVVIGHGEYLVTWPGITLKPYYQPLNEWRNSGQKRPDLAFNRARYIEAAIAGEVEGAKVFEMGA